MATNSELFDEWLIADLLAAEADQQTSRAFRNYLEGTGDKPTTVQLEVREALKATARQRLRNALEAIDHPGRLSND